MPTSYEFEPFERILLERRDDIFRLVNLSRHAFNLMKGSARLSATLYHSPERVERMQELEDMAAQQVAADYPLLHNAAAVLLWGALEAAFRDFLIRWLERNPAARQVPELKKVRVPVADYEAFEGEDRMRYLVGALERELAAALRPGAGRFDSLLKPFGLHAKIEDVQRRDLNELAAVRNVIVHRAGIADRRFLELCPWLNVSEGDHVQVTREALDRFDAAARHYAAAIIDSVETKWKESKGG